MKRILFVVLATATACAHVAGTSYEDPLAGRWRGVLHKGVMTNLVQFDFTHQGNGYRGNYWSPAPTGDPLPLSDIQVEPGVHFRVGSIGSFDGTLHGDTIEGTFNDGQGSGSFTMEKLPDFDNMNLAEGQTMVPELLPAEGIRARG